MMERLLVRINSIYKPEVSYVCHVVFRQFLGVDYSIEWAGESDADYRIYYHTASVAFPNILFHTEREKWLKKESLPRLPLLRLKNNFDGYFCNWTPVLYGDKDEHGIPRIDILGSIFFMLTRYEEIDNKSKDEFGRYQHHESVLHKADSLRRPLVNEYVKILENEIRRIAPSMSFKRHVYSLSLSHDVDVPITYNAPLLDTIRKSIGDLYFRKSPSLFLKRYFGRLVHGLTGSYSYDPNNNLDFIMDAEEKAGVSSVFNFIPAPGVGLYDSRYDLRSPEIRDILKRISCRGFEIGFHPGFDSYCDPDRTKYELDVLNRLLVELKIPIAKRGRQHYLRWVNPVTWRIWNEIGMTEDSSVGFGVVNGFRAGVCYKYQVFDLERREMLNLIEEPLVVMDINSDVNAGNKGIIQEAEYFASVCRYFGGNLTLLYHNNYVISQSQKRTFNSVLRICR